MIRVVGAALLSLTACTDDQGPRLARVEPSAAVAGTTVTITGERLCGPDGDCASAGGAIRVGYDNPVQVMILDYSDTFAEVRIPSITPAGKTALIATVNARSSNALDFEVLAP